MHLAVHSSDGGVLSQLDEYVAYILTTVAVAFLFWTYGPSARKIMEKRAEVLEELAELEQNYMASANQLQEQLQGMEESSALLAERNFESKARSFRRFLHDLQHDLVKDPTSFLGDQPHGVLLEPLRAFVLHWLQAFGLCTPRPRKESLHVASEQELLACADVPELAALLCKRLDDCDVNLLRKSLKKADGLLNLTPSSGSGSEKHRHYACTWCHFGFATGLGWSCDKDHGDVYPIHIRLGLFSITLLSSAHAFLVVSLLKCVLLMALEVCLAKLKFVALLLMAAGGFVAAALRIELVDASAAVERKLADLRRANEDVAHVRSVIHDFHEHCEEVTELWRLQVEPRLEHLEELFERLGDAPKEMRLELLEASNVRLADVARGMGPVEAWVGPKICPSQARDLGCRQLRAHTDTIAASRMDGSASGRILELLRQPIFGLLVVRVRSATGLRNADFSLLGGKSDPYVACKLGEQEFSTFCVRDSLNPVWDSEPFIFELQSGDSELELHVWDMDSYTKGDSLGQVLLDVRGLPRGSWQEQRVPLQQARPSPAGSPHSGGSTTPRASLTPHASLTPRGSLTPRRLVKGHLSFDVYFADAVPEMAWPQP